MTVTIVGTVTGRPECRDELEAILIKQVAPTRAEAGCINYDFHVDAADPCIFVFYEKWRNQEDLDQRLLAKPVEIRQLADDRQLGRMSKRPRHGILA